MIEAIRSGAIDRVLVWSLCRVGRSLTELGRISWRPAGRAGVAMYLHEPQIDTATSNGVSLLDVAPLMVHHLRQSRRYCNILRGQASASPRIVDQVRTPADRAAIRVEKAKRE